ncbi:P-loop containing nucleoside triphosphate hydrolase protein [Cokeromyces recurvatus]|uniref:P-loop containing nucleoside triphosphate hydrolase protein n=1 Tax=Cokeromyces recurvatus TaxID=90255 RepID=UPI0022200735|nr:P-loop containing nucleoside triphosphate hydrolase protein [Cokeromyces recurvatus]KAI7904134.1 P-loop containing nucleoside triphosphate hydrolase protein [Cokeromyces recurvatus]
MNFAALFYGEEGARLDQAFQLAFIENESPLSILLKGDSGIGKSYIVHQLAKKYNVTVYTAMLGDLAANYRGQLNHGLKRILWKAKAPNSLILMEDIDSFFPGHGEIDNGVLIKMLQTWLQTIHHQVGFIATTRHPERISTHAFHLFKDEIQLDIPIPEERYKIMQHIIKQSHFSMIGDDKLIRQLSNQAHAFVAADLAHWCRLAEEDAIKNKQQKVGQDNFERTLKHVKLTSSGGINMAEKPDPVRWNDIGGLKEAKAALEESAIWIYQHADAYQRLGISPSKGILLYGPPGTGKTLLAKAVATESSANFLPVHIPDLIKGEVGESEKAVSTIFKTAIRCSPCVIFLDELEAIFSSRESTGDVGRKLISQFLIEMDHLDKLVDQQVILLGATNHPEMIDRSILRPGRLDRLVYVGPPDREERLAILKVLKQKTRLNSDIQLDLIADQTEGYTGADLKAVIRKAGLLALKQNLTEIQQKNIEQALTFVTPSVNCDIVME